MLWVLLFNSLFCLYFVHFTTEIAYPNRTLEEAERDRLQDLADAVHVEDRHASTRVPLVDHRHPHHHTIDTPNLGSSNRGNKHGYCSFLTNLSYFIVAVTGGWCSLRHTIL